MPTKLKVKLPKRVAGVKIPKSVRKGSVAQFLNSSAGQILLAEALVAAGRSVAIKHTDPDSVTGEFVRSPVKSLKGGGRRIADRSSDARSSIERSSAQLTFALTEAVRAFREALHQQPSSTNPEPARRRTQAKTKKNLPKKKQSSSTAGSAPH